MKIVIDIPEETYKKIRGYSLHHIDFCYTEDVALLSIKNGTPLPKGHGRLIDADEIVKAFKEEKAFYVNSWGGFENMPRTDKARCDETDNCISEVINAQTIIEADKEVDE